MRISTSLAVASALFLTAPHLASAQDEALPAGFTTEPVIRATTNRDGDPISLPTGTTEIISTVATLEPDGRTPLHQHPVPVYAYVLEGEVELRTEGGDPQRYAAGEAWLESQNRMHQAFNVGNDPAKLLIVIIGEEGQAPTVTPE